MSDEYFIQLGLKRKGRIAKNEQYTFGQFYVLVYNSISKLNLFDFMFRKEKFKIDTAVAIMNMLEAKVNSDEFGRKRK